MNSKLLALLLLPVLSLGLHAQATVQVFNADGPGEGFNDPTPATPIGGNPGTTVGAQRQIAFQYAATLWGQQLTSSQVIRVLAFFDPLGCTATSATLGAAAPYFNVRDFPPEPGFPGMPSGTWHPGALGEKLTGFDISSLFGPNDSFELFAFFNSNLGIPGCLTGSGWYYGLDNNPPAGQINLVTVLLHEFGHGLGFTVGPTNANTGARSGGFPSVWEQFMTDATTGKSWLQMTNAERAASARNNENLVWTGPNATTAAPNVLAPRPELYLPGPNSVRGAYEAQSASFGPPLPGGFLRGVIQRGLDGVGVSADGCEPMPSQGQFGLRNRIALIERGGCPFTQKVKSAQTAGAVAVIIYDNVPVGLPSMGGADPTITIPSIGVSQATGQLLLNLPQINGGVPVDLRTSATFRAGLTNGYPRLYAPTTFQQGSSVSHWDVSMFPNQLMEPFINPGLSQSLKPPQDLTFPLLQDIGW